MNCFALFRKCFQTSHLIAYYLWDIFSKIIIKYWPLRRQAVVRSRHAGKVEITMENKSKFILIDWTVSQFLFFQFRIFKRTVGNAAARVGALVGEIDDDALVLTEEDVVFELILLLLAID